MTVLASCAPAAPARTPTPARPAIPEAPPPRELELISERPVSPQPPTFWPYYLGLAADGSMIWADGPAVWRVPAGGVEAPRLLVTLDDRNEWSIGMAPDGTWFGKPKADGNLIRYATTDGSPLEPARIPPCKEPWSNGLWTVSMNLGQNAALVSGSCGKGFWVAKELGATAVPFQVRTSVESASRASILPATAAHPELRLVFDAKNGVYAVDARGKVRWNVKPAKVTMGGAASPDGKYVAVPVYERDGIAILDGTNGTTRWFIEPEDRDHSVEAHREGWLRDGTLWLLRAKRGETYTHTLEHYEITESGPRLLHRSPEFETGNIFPVAVDAGTGELTIVEPSGLFVTRDRDGNVLRRTVLAADGGSATLTVDGRSQCQGSGCKLLRPKQ